MNCKYKNKILMTVFALALCFQSPAFAQTINEAEQYNGIFNDRQTQRPESGISDLESGADRMVDGENRQQPTADSNPAPRRNAATPGPNGNNSLQPTGRADSDVPRQGDFGTDGSANLFRNRNALRPRISTEDESNDLSQEFTNREEDRALTPELADRETDLRDPVQRNEAALRARLQQNQADNPNARRNRILPRQNGSFTRQTVDGRANVERTAGSREQLTAYQPLGIPIKSFFLFPTLGVDETVTDNVFISATRKATDSFTTITPGLRLESNWDNHALEFNVNGVSSHFAKYRTQNTTAFTGSVRARIDVTNRTDMRGGVSYALSQENGTSINFTGSTSPTDIVTKEGFLELNHRFNRLRVRLRGTRTALDYENGAGTAGNVLNNEDRNRHADLVQAQISYEFSPRLTAFMDHDSQWTKYDTPTDDNNIKRGSYTQLNAIGIRTEISAFLSGSIRIGNMYINPKDSQFDDTNAFVVDASVTWTPTELTAITASLASTFAETTEVGSSATKSTQYQLAVSHQLMENFLLNGGLNLNVQESLGNSNQVDTYMATFATEYRMNRNVFITSLLSYTDQNSSQPNADYEIKSATIGVRLQR